MSTPKNYTYKHFLRSDQHSIEHSLTNHLMYTIGKSVKVATGRDWYDAAAHAVRDHLIERWSRTVDNHYEQDPKRVYYLSMEFLIGRTLSNAALNLGIAPSLREGLGALGQRLEQIEELETDAALGNGGLGRLAACFLDSMATLDLPGQGYGIRYEYGMFNQRIENGQQVEHPDNWLRYGNPWEFQRPERLYPVNFYGHVVTFADMHGTIEHHWIGGETVMAMAYDMPIPGYNTESVNNLRLWAAKATREFNLDSFNAGDYIGAVVEKDITENLSKVLYPDDSSSNGRELRLKQEYFFVSASVQDILRRFLSNHDEWNLLPEKIAIQLNDTHPAIAVAELMHQLLDTHHLKWDYAWSLVTSTFAYTNHTLMPEALETWPVEIFGRVLPRHLEIIYEINSRFLGQVNHSFPGDTDLLKRVSIIDEMGGRRVRMAHLAVVGSHTVNGVAAIHSELLKTALFADFHRIFPAKFINVTNGITPRRWLHQANPRLSELIASRIGSGFVRDLAQLGKLVEHAEDPKFRAQFRAVKHANKLYLAEYIGQHIGVRVDADSLFDVQVKRIHEYKRQLLNVLHVITLYNRIRCGQTHGITPRTVIFGGKAAPAYWMAKLIIRLINDVAAIVNHDPAVGDLLKVVFYPNYNVSMAEKIFPASELSEQISTAGTEASGTGNMKMALNGALTIGTLDGANIEIREEVGDDNIFIFGLTTPQVAELRARGYNPWEYYHGNAELRQALDLIGNGFFSVDEPGRYRPIFESLLHNGDNFLLLADYASYIAAQDRVSALYQDHEEWARRAILNVAHMGRFSSDRTIQEYAKKVWDVKPVTPVKSNRRQENS
ncbi:MAG: glycogen/starch/alpha-glucan phosphorylase [Gammaproteobacteria bacterium]|nr:glycogen/starch/alpha-glucan phosphorylase [Gammaproteobacteria bacterium]